jgi:hypothetical protein
MTRDTNLWTRGLGTLLTRWTKFSQRKRRFWTLMIKDTSTNIIAQTMHLIAGRTALLKLEPANHHLPVSFALTCGRRLSVAGSAAATTLPASRRAIQL